MYIIAYFDINKMSKSDNINPSNNLELRLPKSSYDEITINIVGNVDSGKSSLCGILSHPLLREDINNLPKILDDGNGLSRSRVLALRHEQESGRTSSISYNYMIFDQKPKSCIASLVDLAGHEVFLKTTITGIMSSYPEYGLVLIAKNITQMTREHYSILASMGIPILFVLTKTDIIPEHIIKSNINRINILSKRYGKTIMEIKNMDDIATCMGDPKIFGYIKVSNKDGSGIPLLVEYISKIKPSQKDKNLVSGFAIDNVYHNITGFSLVVSGITGAEIKKGDSMVLGPFKNNEFVPVKIRSIHNDYRQFVDILSAGMRGCLCLRIDNNYKNYIRMGMTICHKVSDVNSVKKFEANVAVFRGNVSNIKVGYNSYINMNLVRGGIKFIRIIDPETKEDIKTLREKKHTTVHIEFMTNFNTISVNDRFLFRSNRCLGIGKIINLL
jgi:GTPase